MTWPEGHIPEGWTDFFETRGISQQASANNCSGMALSEVLHEGLTIALAAKKFGLLGGGGREGGRGDEEAAVSTACVRGNGDGGGEAPALEHGRTL